MGTSGGGTTGSEPGTSSPPGGPEPGELIGGRYRVVRQLGRGGMGVVVEVEDEASGARIALKRLRPSDSGRGNPEDLFELEYHSLSELRHPAIVRAFEYGRDELGPYYTMELLSGGEVRSLTPIPWRHACGMLVEICSALSLLHSRRLVHRDVTVRNIHCTESGEVRLIDFGVLTSSGPANETVGTPPYCAPETFGLQVVDARTDLYALGATAYYLLAGRHAYPARTFGALRQAWRVPPQPPSTFIRDIPSQLDQLVLEMLSLDAVARPRSAVEVMQRLAAVADLELEYTADVKSSYLTTPTLVGRSEQLDAVRKRLSRARTGKGCAMLLCGEPGVGKTRFLNACLLEAKLMGSAVLRTGLVNKGRPWEALATLLQQLRVSLGGAWDSLPADTGQLAKWFPELKRRRAPSSSPKVRIEPSERAAVMAAAIEVAGAAATTHCMVVAFDDLPAIDEPSAALGAWLARETDGHRLVVLATATEGSACDALALMARSAASVRLQPLSEAETRTLLGSVFGEVPNLDLLANRVHTASRGIPRTIMHLAQHLIDTDTIAFLNGAFVLPANLALASLPADERAAIQLRATQLSPHARALAEVIALYPRPSITFSRAARISRTEDRAGHVAALAELLSAGLLVKREELYSLSDRDMRSALVAAIEPTCRQDHCARIADAYRDRPQDFPLVVDFLVQAGRQDEALSHLLAHLDDVGSRSEVGSSLADRLQELPEGWLSTCERLLTYGESKGQPLRDGHRIRAYLVATGTWLGAPVGEHAIALVAQLARDVGLDLYDKLAEPGEPAARLQAAIERACKRYQEVGQREHVLSPTEAIPTFARSVSLVIAMFADAYDRTLLERIPDIAPLTELSPTLNLIWQNHQSSMHYRVGRYREAREGFLAMARRLQEPDRCGFDPHAQTYIRLSVLFAVAMMDVAMGRASCLSLADQIGEDPLFRVHATRIRMMHAITQGQVGEADRHKQTADLLTIQNTPSKLFEGSRLWIELNCRIACDDLLRVQELIPDLQRLVDRFESWQPMLHLAQASYQRIRGNHSEALREIKLALPLVKPGVHGAWPAVARAHCEMLRLAGSAQASRDAARASLELAVAHRLPLGRLELRQALAEALRELGEYGSAIQHADMVIVERSELASGGVALGSAHETRARIAIAMKDDQEFARQAEACARCYCAGGSPALAAKYERLVQEARRSGAAAGSDFPGSADDDVSSMVTALSECRGSVERLDRALAMILKSSTARVGYLYVLAEGGPRLVAHSPGHVPSHDADEFARTLLETEIQRRTADADTVTMSSRRDALSARFRDPEAGSFVGYVLEHGQRHVTLITGVVVLGLPDRLNMVGLGSVLPAVSEALHAAGDAVGQLG